MILTTERLALRELAQTDFQALCKIMQDPETMYAYEGAFTDEEVQGWLDRQLARYEKLGFGLWAVVLRETGEVIGQCGLTLQPWKDQEVLEVGYLFQRACWHKGYAAEAARACRDYAFRQLGAGEVCSIVRDTNTASQNVAKRNGMTPQDTWVKHFRGVDMPHIRFVVKREDWLDIRIQWLTPELAGDFFDYFENQAFPQGDPRSACYCLESHFVNENDWVDQAQRREKARELIETGVTTGYLLYSGNQAIGWCNAGDKASYSPLCANEEFFTEPPEKGKIKVLYCMDIACNWQGKGLANLVMERFLADAQREGYAWAEGYPFTNTNAPWQQYRGPLRLYEKYGFETVRQGPLVTVMRKELL